MVGRIREFLADKLVSLAFVPIDTLSLVFWGHFSNPLPVHALVIVGARPVGDGCAHHLLFFFEKVILLRTQDGARASDPNPANEGGCGEFKVLHCVTADERPCAAETCLAVHGDGTLLLLAHPHELIQDLLRR